MNKTDATENKSGDLWTPKSWRRKPVSQVPAYPDPEALARAEELVTFKAPSYGYWGGVRR